MKKKIITGEFLRKAPSALGGYLGKYPLVRILILIALWAFALFSIADAYYSKTLEGVNGDSKHAKWPFSVLLHPTDSAHPDCEILVFRKNIFTSFSQKGKIYFYVHVFPKADDSADGVTLEVYADGKLIATQAENPYLSNEYIEGKKSGTKKEGNLRTVEFDFAIPPGTSELKIRANPNQNPGWDNTILEEAEILSPNFRGICLFLIVIFLLAILSVPSRLGECRDSRFLSKDGGEDGMKERRSIFFQCLFALISVVVLFLSFDSNTFQTAGKKSFDTFQMGSEAIVTCPVILGNYRGMGGLWLINRDSDEELFLHLSSYMTPMDVTDKNYKAGVHRHSTGLLLKNNAVNRHFNKAGAIATFKDGSRRKISNVKADGKGLIVSFHGDPLSFNLGYPYMYRTDAKTEMMAYISQAGLSAWVFTALSTLHPPAYLYNSVVALALALVLTGISLLIKRELGWKYAVAFIVGCIFSRWLVMMGRNLYWVPALFFLPMFLTALWVKTNKKVWLIICFLALLLKFLNGYEYMTTILIAMCIPIVYAWIKHKTNFFAFLRKIAIQIVCSICAFLLSLAITCALPEHSFEKLLSRATERTLSEKIPWGISSSVPKNLAKYLDDTPLGLLGMPLPVFIFVSCSFAFLLVHSADRRKKALGVSTLFSILAPLSWFVLARQHSHVHTHINYVLWAVPFIPMGFMAIVGVLDECAHRIYQRFFVRKKTNSLVNAS